MEVRRTAPGRYNTLRRACVAMAAVLAVMIGAPEASAQQCPADDPDQNYNCAVGPVYTLPPWGNVPWSLSSHYTTIVTGDFDGDGRDELLGRDSSGVHVWSFNSALGIWQPWLSSAGNGILVLPLSDAAGWNQPQYGSTLTPVTLAGRTGKVLAARGPTGVILYALTRGQLPRIDLPAGSWMPLTSSGPLADGDCFANNRCWNAPPYYQTIRFGDVDGQSGDELTAWGGDNGVAYKWNGSGWVALTGFPLGVDAALYPAAATTRQFADMDGEPGQELVNWDTGGLNVHKYVPDAGGGTWRPFLEENLFGVACLQVSNQPNPSCYSTLQTAPIGGGVTAAFMRIPGCHGQGSGGGLAGARWNDATKAWEVFLQNGPFDDCSGFDKPQYYQTIQFAHITGNAVPELLARGPGGIVIYQWNGSTFVPLSSNQPALADSTWALDPSYWQTIRTANVDGSGRAALLARGPTGMRTWLWQNGAYARPIAYGGFPKFTGAQATAYTLLNQFLGLAQGTIRDTYTNPSVDNTSSALRAYLSLIRNARNGCQGEVSGNPPQYETCDPLVGATNPAYTTVVNQILKELWWAASVIDRFTTVQSVQTQLFAVQGTEFPSIATHLQLPQATGPTEVDYLTLFSRVETLIGQATGQPEFTVEAAAINVGLSALPFFRGSSTSKYSATYAEIQGQIAILQQSLQASNLSQKHFVLSDYALLSTVGQLVASQAWTIDEAGYLSASRRGFTEWVYQSFLVNLWSYYEVVGCGMREDSTILCYVPPNGPNMEYYQPFEDRNGTYVNFNGLMPNASPVCSTSCSNGSPPVCSKVCTFPTPSPTTVSVLTTPVSTQCTYNPQAGTAWVYANPSANPPTPGCTLGATPAAFEWTFPVTQVNTEWSAFALDTDGAVAVFGDQANLRLSGTAQPLPPGLDLAATRLTVQQLLYESGFAGELVRDVAGEGWSAITMRPSLTRRGREAIYETPRGASPHMRVALRPGLRTPSLIVEVNADALRLSEPFQCRGTPATTRLLLAMEIAGGGLSVPRVLAQVQDWECVFDATGRVTALRAVGAGAYDVQETSSSSLGLHDLSKNGSSGL